MTTRSTASTASVADRTGRSATPRGSVPPQKPLPVNVAAPSRTWHQRLDRTGAPYLLVSPFFFLFAVFGVFPLGYTVYVSMTAWNPRRPGTEGQFVGLDNYRRLLEDDNFRGALVNTFGIGILSTVPQLMLALLIAHLLNGRMRGRLFFRMGVLAPYVTSVTAVALVFSQLFARDFGPVNWALSLVGLGPVDWRASTWASWTAISVMVIWRWTGYNALIYLAALQSVPYDLYEAATVDGASTWRKFWSITIPSLRPTIIFTVIISTIGALQLFGEPYLFDSSRAANGGSGRQFQTVVLYLYQQFWFNARYGYASAIAIGLLVVIAVVVLLNLVLTRRIASDS